MKIISYMGGSLLVQLLLMVLLSNIALGFHPFITEDAVPIGKFGSELEITGQWSTDTERVQGSKLETRTSQIATTYGFGVGEKVDLNISFSREWGETFTDGQYAVNSGSSAFTLFSKWQFYEDSGLSLAIKPLFGYSYPVNSGKNDYTLSFAGTVVATKEFEPFAVHLNTGYQHNSYRASADREGKRNNIYSFSVAATWDVVKEFKLVSDFGVATNQDKAYSELPVYALAGAVYSATGNMDISFGVKFGLTKPEPDFAATGGITFKF